MITDFHAEHGVRSRTQRRANITSHRSVLMVQRIAKIFSAPQSAGWHAL